MLGAWRDRLADLEREIAALALAARDARTPLAAKAVLLVVVAYAVSPIDPIPDVIPVVGYLDELLVLPVGVALARRLVPEVVLADCRPRADEVTASTRLRWAGATLTVLVWLAVALLVVRFVV